MDRKYAAKVALDIVFCGVAFFIPFFKIFTCYKYVDVYMIGVGYRKSSEFEVYRPGENCDDVVFFNDCKTINSWRTAGILYVICSFLAVSAAVYCILAIFNYAKRWNIKYLDWSSCHFLHPIIYTASIAVYVFVSFILDLKTPIMMGEEYNLQLNIGSYLIILSEMISLISLAIYSFTDFSSYENKEPLLIS